MPWMIPVGMAVAGGIAGAMGSKSSYENEQGIRLDPRGDFERSLFGGKERIQLSAKDFQARKGVFNRKGEKVGNTREDLSRLRQQGMADIDYVNEDAEEAYEAAVREGRNFREEDHGKGLLPTRFEELDSLVQKGPGERDVTAGLDAQRGLADMLGEMSKTGGLPGQQDIEQANTLAGGLFNARRTALDQSFTDQSTEANRLAARLGRSTNDPILQAKLRTGFMRQKDLLQAEQSDYGNQLALSLPNQRLSYASGRADVLGGLASQAFQNRAAILSMGSQLGGAERQFRIATGTQVGKGEQKSGGGVAGAISGGIAGAGAGMSMMGLFGGSGSTGGNTGGGGVRGVAAAPAPAPSMAANMSNFASIINPTQTRISDPMYNGAQAYGVSNSFLGALAERGEFYGKSYTPRR